MYDNIFQLITDELDNQESKGKSFSHPESIWATIVMDYLGRTVRRLFAGEKADHESLVKALAVGVAWLEEHYEDTHGTKE